MSRYDDRSRKLARQRYWDEHDRQSYRCPDCGRAEEEIVGEFQVHHKSRNPHDNRLQKLVGLCGYCHRLREGKKPSLKRLRQIRDNDTETETVQIHPFVKSFIDERLCLCSNGRDYAWFDVMDVHFTALDNHLQEWGYSFNDKFKTDLVAAYRLLPETEINWLEDEDGLSVAGPDVHGCRGCDCLTSDDLSQQNCKPGDWR